MSGIQRFLTRREKHRHYGKDDKESLGAVTRTSFRGLFAASSVASESDKEEEKKVKSLERRIVSLGITGFKIEHLQYALGSKYAQGDEDRAFEMLLLFEDSIEGVIQGYTSRTKLLGAENRNGVTCYLDALLFAMFARLDCFEAILYKSFNDDPRGKLVVILRLWVNMLRSGKLITTDITEHLQGSLSECGWPEAAELRQQDASEAFTFITEKLELPLLTLKMDIYHTGKEDVADDHKFVNERLLEVAIPADHPDGSSLTLEDCLEAYFNNRIEVKRHLGRRCTISSVKSFDSTVKSGTSHVESIEVSSSASSPILTDSPRIEDGYPLSPVADTINPFISHYRRPSIVQERFIPGGDGQEVSLVPPRLRKGSYRKEVMMPAWQFFSLIPWYTDNTPTSDAQVATHFSVKRPILGMCLKRYSVLPNGNAIRLNTYIDIPIEIGLPHFIQDDQMDESGPLYGNFKLSLQSVVCHRGNSVDSGHYIALVRGTSSNAVPPASSSSDSNSLQGSEAPDHWMRFDDLAVERITLVNIEQALKEESPYLLFYQIVPIDEEGTGSNGQENRASYTEPEEDTDAPHVSSVANTDDELLEASIAGSTRPSFEITAPELAKSEQYRQSEREQSVTFLNALESSVHETKTRSLQAALAASSGTSTPKEGSRSSFSLSRPSSKGPKGRSRSRGDEKRLSAALSRLSLRLSREKLQSEPNSAVEDDDEPNKADVSVDNIITTNITISADDRDNKGSRSHRGRQAGKLAQTRKEGKNPDRECLIM